MTAFGGFPPGTIRFLRELRLNNRKDWFDAHQANYQAYWVAPAKAFVVAAGQQLGGATLKRPPAGFASGGPAGRFLVHKALFVHHDGLADERVHTDAILTTCMRHWSALAPLHRWLTDKVQGA
jgi:hypothetical protein